MPEDIPSIESQVAWLERMVRVETKLDIVISNHSKALDALRIDVEDLKGYKNQAIGAMALAGTSLFGMVVMALIGLIR